MWPDLYGPRATRSRSSQGCEHQDQDCRFCGRSRHRTAICQSGKDTKLDPRFRSEYKENLLLEHKIVMTAKLTSILSAIHIVCTVNFQICITSDLKAVFINIYDMYGK